MTQLKSQGVHVIPPDDEKGTMPSGNIGTFQSVWGAADPNYNVKMEFQITAGGSPLGQCAVPEVEEAIYNPAVGYWQKGKALAGVFYWDAASSSIIDIKSRSRSIGIDQYGNWLPAGTVVAEVLQAVRVIFPGCDGWKYPFASVVFQVTTYAGPQPGQFTIKFTQPPNPLPGGPPRW